jgi:nucleoside-diphosphate-sugar epimerase
MDITVFGGTGGIGRHVLSRLLERGDHVTAYVRDPDKLGSADPRLTVAVGPLSDPRAIAAAVRGSEAVISALGPSLRPGSTGTPVADGTRHIVAAMQHEGVRRYVGLATPSIPDPRDRPALQDRVVPVLARLAFPNARRELVGMTEAVTGSGLDWTVARITRPTDKPARGTLRAGYLGRDQVGTFMTRADIAGFLVDQLEDTRYLNAAPAISN